MGINHLCRCRDYKIGRIVKQSSLGDTFLVSHTLYLTLGSIYRVHTSLSHHLCQDDEYWISAHIYCVYCLLIYLLILYRRRGTSSFWTHLKVVQPPTACHTIIQHQPGSIPASGQPPPRKTLFRSEAKRGVMAEGDLPLFPSQFVGVGLRQGRKVSGL